jgi:hypothetical protein
LIPDWRFFAPEPGTADQVVVYRVKSHAAGIGPLETLGLPSSGALRCLWNPRARRYKALWDLTDGLPRFADRLIARQPRSDVPDALLLTPPYLVLLNVVSAQLELSGRGLVQFGIIRRAWPDREELVFLSRWHRV